MTPPRINDDEPHQPHQKHYLRSDGNGGLVISKRTMALFSFLILLGGILVGFVSQALAFNERLVTIELAAKTAEHSYSEVQPVVVKGQQDIAVIQEQHRQFVQRQAEEDARLQRIEDKLDRALQQH